VAVKSYSIEAPDGDDHHLSAFFITYGRGEV
jgi:hypothetical protein